ncbi:peptidase C14, partial [Streptomyces sp. NPDC089733]
QGQAGLPTILAERSTPLRTGTADDRDTIPVPQAPPAFREELADRLQEYLGSRGVTDLERAAVVGGHTVDLLFTAGGENTAVLIDAGPPPGQDPARHLRLSHARGDLLIGLPSGGRGAKPAPVTRTVRLPAWRVEAGPALLDPLFT